MAQNRMQGGCMQCYKYVGPYLSRHMKDRCKASDKAATDAQVSLDLIGMYREAAYNITGNVFVNPKKFKKEVYSKREVLEILEQYGHSMVPVEFCNQCEIVPVPLVITEPVSGVGPYSSGDAGIGGKHGFSDEETDPGTRGKKTVNCQRLPAARPLLPTLTDISENVDFVGPLPPLPTLPDNLETVDYDGNKFVFADTYSELLNVSTESLCHMPKPICSSDEETASDAAIGKKYGLSSSDEETDAGTRGKKTENRQMFPAPRPLSARRRTTRPLSSTDEETDETDAGASGKHTLSGGRLPDQRPRPLFVESSDDSDKGNTTVTNTVSHRRVLLSEPSAGCSKWADGKGHAAARRQSPRAVRTIEPVSNSSSDVEEGRQNRYKAGTKGSLENIGWYNIPASFKSSAPFLNFRKQFANSFKNQRVTDNGAFNVIRMTYHMGGRQDTYTDKCLTEDAYNEVNKMLLTKGGCKFQTLYNYNKSLKLFVKCEQKRAKTEQRKADKSRLKDMHAELCDKGQHLEKESKRETRVAKSKAPRVPSPYEVTEVIRVSESRFGKIMSLAKSGMPLNRDQVCFVNRYIASYIMLMQAHRPGVLENMTTDLVLTSINEKEGPSAVVNVSEHKTARQFIARVVLDEYLIPVFESYHRYVRQRIVITTNCTSEAFFLQNDGSKFTKFSEAPVKLQQAAKLPTKYTSADARKSFETYNQKMGVNAQKDMADFMCHSERTRNSDYRQKASAAAIGVVANYKHMIAFYHPDKGNKNAFPDEVASAPQRRQEKGTVAFPREVTRTPGKRAYASSPESGENSAHCRSPMKRIRPVPVSSIEQWELESQEEVEEPTPLRTPSPRKGKKTERKKVLSPLIASVGSSPMNIQQKVNIILRDLTVKYGDLLAAKMPGTSELAKQYNIDKNTAARLNRKLRYAVEDGREKRCAERLLNATAKRQRCKLNELSELPAFPQDMRIFQHVAGNVKITEKGVVRHMKAIMHAERRKLPDSDEQIKMHIDGQDWPNLCIKTCDNADMGDGVFSGNLPFAKGSLVCDYHGRDCTAQEGREVMSNAEGCIGNYVYFYTDRHGKRLCKDACTGCECHSEEEFNKTYGRKINHSTARPNLKAVTTYIDTKCHLLFYATTDIPPKSELFFSYGVTRDESGAPLPWANT
ncbi:MAG: SET domain-containing protein-lysine N-methyltransferase [Sedimenticola sp.]